MTRGREFPDVADVSQADGSDGGIFREDGAAYADKKPVFDLEERTALFGGCIIRLCKRIPHSEAPHLVICIL
jgi:hypothetical protein